MEHDDRTEIRHKLRFANKTVTPGQASGREQSRASADKRLNQEAQHNGSNGLDELEAPPPDEDQTDGISRQRRSLEKARDESRERSKLSDVVQSSGNGLLVQLYTCCWLIFFSIFGTLARLGTQWITYYPTAPIVTNELWANVGGCFVLGFLMEDRSLFRDPTVEQGTGNSRPRLRADAGGDASQGVLDQLQQDYEKRQATAAHLSHKKTLPLYIGLSVGFCGSYTSFSSFMRDAFLALSNDLVAKNAGPAMRSVGWSVCAFLGVVIMETGLSLAALSAGAHVCEALMPLLHEIPAIRLSYVLNPLSVLLGPGCWLGALLLAIWPPQDRWRSDCMFAIVFAPLGCLLRYWLAIRLNSRVARFPIGTFIANVFGSMVLAMAFDLQHAPLSSVGGLVGGGYIGCQVLQGIMDGFCGCLTTVSTWVAELKALRKRHAYEYGLVSIIVGFVFMLVIIGPLHWTIGLSKAVCTP